MIARVRPSLRASLHPSVRPTSHLRVENSEMASRFLRSQLGAANTILRQLKEVLELADTDQPRIPEAADDDDEVVVDEDEQKRQRPDFDGSTSPYGRNYS